MFYKGHYYELEMNLTNRCVRLSVNPSGATLTQPLSVFASQEDIEKILDELIIEGQLMAIRNDDSYYDPIR